MGRAIKAETRQAQRQERMRLRASRHPSFFQHRKKLQCEVTEAAGQLQFRQGNIVQGDVQQRPELNRRCFLSPAWNEWTAQSRKPKEENAISSKGWRKTPTSWISTTTRYSPDIEPLADTSETIYYCVVNYIENSGTSPASTSEHGGISIDVLL